MSIIIQKQAPNEQGLPKTAPKFSEHRVTIINRKNITITGVTEVNATSESAISVDTTNGVLNVIGKDLHLNKISVEEGVLEAAGTIYELKYLEKKEKVNFLKRMFK